MYHILTVFVRDSASLYTNNEIILVLNYNCNHFTFLNNKCYDLQTVIWQERKKKTLSKAKANKQT